MAFVAENDYVLATAVAEKEINKSPLMRSLANMDLEIKAILIEDTIPVDR